MYIQADRLTLGRICIFSPSQRSGEKEKRKKKPATELTETSIADEQKKVQHGDGDGDDNTHHQQRRETTRLSASPTSPHLSRQRHPRHTRDKYTQALIAVTARESNLHVCACQRKTKTPSRANGRGLLELSPVSIVSCLCWFVDRLTKE